MNEFDDLREFHPEPLWEEKIVGSKPILIAGPCSAETHQQVLDTAHALSQKGIKIFRAGVWKPRTMPNQFEGIGEEALTWLAEVKEKTGMLVGTEIGLPQQAELALKHKMDFVWIGARTTSSPFIIQEIAEVMAGSDLPILVKNPLSPSLNLWKGAIMRLVAEGIKKIGLVHRGFDIGIPSPLRNTPLWDDVANLRNELPHIPIYLDPSHIAGNREYLMQLILLAHLLHYDGIMIESHLTPDKALSDKNQQITPHDLAQTLEMVKAAGVNELHLLRDELGWLDEQLMVLLSLRRKLSHQIGEVKKEQGDTPFQESEYLKRLVQLTDRANDYNIPQGLAKILYRIIHNDSIKIQSKSTTNAMREKLKTEEHCITLNKLRFFSYHGLLAHEKRVGNTFEVTVALYFPAFEVMENGHLEAGINYAEVYQLIEREMAIPTELLEALAQRILEHLGSEFSLLTSAHISITKIAPPIAGFEGEGVTFSAKANYKY